MQKLKGLEPGPEPTPPDADDKQTEGLYSLTPIISDPFFSWKTLELELILIEHIYKNYLSSSYTLYLLASSIRISSSFKDIREKVDSIFLTEML